MKPTACEPAPCANRGLYNRVYRESKALREKREPQRPALARLLLLLNADFIFTQRMSDPMRSYFSLIIFSLLASVGLSQTPRIDLRQTNDQAALLKAVETNADPYEAAKACQRLAEIGDQRAIEPLARLLSDPQLANYARNALEGIPSSKGREALRDSLGRTSGDRLVGVIGSLGRLRDTSSVEQLGKFLNHQDMPVAEAAGRALAKIANPPSAGALKSAFITGPASLKHSHAMSCLQCAQQLLKDHDTATGLDLLDFLRLTNVGSEIKMAATVQSILAAGPQNIEVLMKTIHAADAIDFQAALQAVRQIIGDQNALAGSLAEALPTLAPDRQASVICAIADLKTAAPIPVVQELAKSGTSDVKVEAIRLLSQQRDVSFLKSLLEYASSVDDAVSSAGIRACGLAFGGN